MMRKYKKWHVYVLICPKDNIVRYIGITSKNPSVRFMQHIIGKGSATKKKKEWIQSLKDEGKLPIFKVIESGIQEEEARKKESSLIQEYKAMYPGKITNV